MSDQAKVTNHEALDSLRTAMVIFMEKAGKALDEVADAVRRTRYWVQDEQPARYLAEKKRAERKLEQAEQELYSSRLSTLEEVSGEAQMMVRRARRRLEEIEDKLRVLKKWGRDYDSAVEPLARRLDSMHDLVKAKYPKAVAELARILSVLEEYAATAPTPPPPATGD